MKNYIARESRRTSFNHFARKETRESRRTSFNYFARKETGQIFISIGF
jgi:hypothetical protein